MTTVGIKPDRTLTIVDCCRVAHGEALVELSGPARDRIRSSREVVDRALEAARPVYGLNTGLGHALDQRVADPDLPAYQHSLIAGHAAGIGEPLPTEITRAAMLARVNGIARGGAGVSLEAAEVLVAMLNAGVHPVVPEVGSVGAADLMHMAAIAQVATGHGWAEYHGEVMEGAQALRLAGIRPLHPQPKDALALISANAVATGHAALVASHAAVTATVADVVAALSLEAIRGNLESIEPAVAAAKPLPGHERCCHHLRGLLTGSELAVPGHAASLQDPISFRVVPQVHGALLEWLTLACRAVSIELNGLGDNPLVAISEGRLLHNGNFCPLWMALSFDALRPALAHVGVLSERRMQHLVRLWWGDPRWLKDRGVGAGDPADASVLSHYAAAALLAELRHLAGPATLDVPSLDMGVEDHASAAPLTVALTARALKLLDDVLAVEALIAVQAVRRARTDGRLGRGTRLVQAHLAEVLEQAPAGSSAAGLHGRVRAALWDARLLGRLNDLVGWSSPEVPV